MLVNGYHVDSIFPKRPEHGCTLLSSMATSPAMAASLFDPVKAAHVFRPILALIDAPVSFNDRSSRPTVIL